MSFGDGFRTIVHQSSVPFNLARWQFLAAAALLTAPAARCRVPPGPSTGSRPVPMERFTGAPGPYAYFSGIDDSLRLVIRDPAHWQRYWTAIHSRVSPQPPLPAIDFGHEIVLLAALGRRPSGGYSIRIDSVRERSGMLEVYVERLAPGRGCIVSAVVSSPVDIVHVESRANPVVFVDERKRDDCR